MSVIPNTRGNPQASEIAVQTALPMVGSASREDLQATLGFADAELAKLFEDRNVLLADGGLVTYLGTTVTFTQPLSLHINSKIAGGAPVIVDLDDTTRTISANGRMIYAVVNRTAGTAVVTDDAATLPAVTSADQEVFLIAKRIDSGDGTLRLYFRNGSAFDQGQTARLGSSGSGSGDANADLETFKNTLIASTYELVTPVIFPSDESDFVDGASTGAYNLVTKRFVFDATGETYVSTQLLDADGFLDEGKDLSEVEVVLNYDKTHIDDSPTVEVSRNSGGNYQPVTVERINGTDTYRGRLVFAETETQANQFEYAVANADDTEPFNATTKQKLSQAFTVTNPTVLRSIDLYLNKLSTALGLFYVSIVRASGSNPSTLSEDIMGESQAVDISALATGNITSTVALPNIVLPAGTYHIVLRTDAAYKASFVASTVELRWRSDASSPALVGRQFDGSAWTAGAEQFTYLLKGRVLNLRLKITASNPAGDNADNEFRLRAFGLFYAPQEGLLLGTKLVDRKYFLSNSQNLASFDINFNPDPDLLTVWHVENGQGYKYPAFSISGRTISFAANTFQQESDTPVSLIFMQAEGSIDNSDQNAGDIANIKESLTDNQVQLSYLTAVTSSPGAGQFLSSVIGRSKIIDFGNDLLPRMHNDRIYTQVLVPVSDESGPSNQPVWKVPNDRFNQIRMVGAWVNGNDDNGPQVRTPTWSDPNDYLEVTFYGTGLNILIQPRTATITSDVETDGGSAVATTITTSTMATNIAGRNSPSYTVIPITAGLTYGLHTVKLKGKVGNASDLRLHGIEILNESLSVKTNPGSAIVDGLIHSLASLNSSTYNTGFESGTLGTRGGRVSIYMKTDGTMAKAVMPVDASALLLSSANHTNEEPIRNYFFREFGVGRSDDFSTLLSDVTGFRGYTLDDGLTTLIGSTVRTNTNLNYEYLNLAVSVGAYATLTFVGTGLDILANYSGSGVAWNVSIDGGSTNAITTPSASSRLKHKIVSGLPYGTHTAKFTTVTGASNYGIEQFIVYGPKKPTIPAGALELADYNILGNFEVVSGGTNTAIAHEKISQGVIRKVNLKEITYTGAGWTTSAEAISTPENLISGFRVQTVTTTQFAEFTFEGTGFDFRYGQFSNNATSVSISVDGSTNLSGFTTVVYGGTSFANNPAVLNQNLTSGSGSGGLAVTGLTYGKHVVRVTYTSGGAALRVDGFDVVTPIHVNKNNNPTVQNTLSIGNQGLSDNRPFGSQLSAVKRSGFAQGVVSNPTTIGTNVVPLANMSMPVYAEEDGQYLVDFCHPTTYQTAGGVNMLIYVDGYNVLPNFFTASDGGDMSRAKTSMAHNMIFLSKGWHQVMIMWNFDSGANTVTSRSVDRRMTVSKVS